MQEFSPPPPPQAPTPQMGNGQMYAGVPKKLSLKIRKKTNAIRIVLVEQGKGFKKVL